MDKSLLDEIKIKIARLHSLRERYQVEGILLRRVSSFAWITGGIASYVNTATTDGAASVLVTGDKVYVLTNNIEAPRLEQEAGLADLCSALGWELHVSPWTTPQARLSELTRGMRLAVDGGLSGAQDISTEISRLRSALLPAETERMAELSRLCAQAISATAHQLQPGMNEQHIAAILGSEVQSRGAQPIVNLIATDERVYQFRHPLPTDKKLARYAMLVLCGRKWGLVSSVTRLVHFGPLPADLSQRINATLSVFAAFYDHTRPGKTLSAIFAQAKTAYVAQGYGEEWQRHHQGGIAGYEPREFLGIPGSQDIVSIGQVYAWNPSIAGAKIEDTILVGEKSNLNLTTTLGWPEIQVALPDSGGVLSLAGALEL